MKWDGFVIEQVIQPAGQDVVRSRCHTGPMIGIIANNAYEQLTVRQAWRNYIIHSVITQPPYKVFGKLLNHASDPTQIMLDGIKTTGPARLCIALDAV